MIGPIIGVLFDGFAYGMLLFLLSVGLSVTLGMMNFVNLAHCAFAMLGGYVTVTLVNDVRLAVPRDPADGVPRRGGRERRARAHAVSPALSRERTRPGAAHHRPRLHVDGDRGLYLRHHPAAGADAVLICAARSTISASISASIACSWSALRCVVTLLLVLMLEYTRFGPQVRAAVDNQRMARGLGINVDGTFA